MKQSDKSSKNIPVHKFVEDKGKAFDYIFRKHYGEMCARAFIYVKDEMLAQSIVQDCFVQVWEKWDKLDETDKLGPFLTVLVRNKAIDYLRKQTTETNTLNEVSYEEREKFTENLAVSFEFEEQLMLAISHLPKRCREAFEYSRFHGLTYVQIAEKMGISSKAVEALIGRSLKLLRYELIDYLPLFYLFLLK